MSVSYIKLLCKTAFEEKISFFFFFYNFDLLLYFIFGCAGSSLLGVGFLWLWQAGTKKDSLLGRVGCSLQWLFLCSTDPGVQASAVVAHGLSC